MRSWLAGITNSKAPMTTSCMWRSRTISMDEDPKAHLQKEVDFEKARNGMMVADPLTLYDCCPTSDGASVAILASDRGLGMDR